MATSGLTFLTWNIGNPSEQRAERQLAWLAERREHVIVLTETKGSAGCRRLADAFTAAGWYVSYPVPGPGEYGVMIVSQVQAQSTEFSSKLGYLPTRATSIALPAPSGVIEVIGAYVPSRDAGVEKTERKRTWLAACQKALAARDASRSVVLLGDLNVLEPGHRPHYPFFAPFEYEFYRSLSNEHGLVDSFRYLHPDAAEYSWVGRTGDGYRYDHAFCSADLTSAVSICTYVHEPRAQGLSDHSALIATLAVPPPPALPVSDPVSTAAPATLF